MSIKIMSTIWERGPENQSERFVLLALADYSNDDGECWPSISGIADKTCLTTRGVQKVIRRLQDSGWLEIIEGGGRKNCHLYRIKTLNAVHPERGSPLNVVPQKGERGSINPERGSPEPSITIIEPSKESRDAHDAIAAYNDFANRNGWAAVQDKSAARLSATKARLKSVGGLEGWRMVLERAEASDFLMGRCEPRKGSNTPFRMTFKFFSNAEKFAEILEGNYDNRTGKTAGHDARAHRPGAGMAQAFAAVAERLSRDAQSGAGGGRGAL